jgi:hypothetical protein
MYVVVICVVVTELEKWVVPEAVDTGVLQGTKEVLVSVTG